jgi:zinc transport system permease protein
MFEILAEMFSYSFLVRAVIVGALVSICAALLGVSLVLKRYSMIGHGLSNVGFGSLALATALGLAPLAVAIPLVIGAAFLLLRLSENSKIKGDAAVAVVATASLAIGVIIISLSTGMNTDVCNYLFGSILAMGKTDVYISVALSVTVMLLFILFYNKLFAITFDETFAHTAGVKVSIYNMLIALLTALTIVLGMRMMGAMLISSLIIFPALSSMRLFKKFKDVTICSAVISIICFFTGVVISYLYSMPTGASVVAVNIIVFAVFSFADFMRSKSMIKTMNIFLFAVVLLFTASGCRNDGIIKINERVFIGQVNDVYLNPNDYLGKTVRLEGLFFASEVSEWQEEPYYMVIRYGPGGCCGIDGLVGFEVAWTGNKRNLGYPQNDSWVEATGQIKLYGEEEYMQFLYIDLQSLKVLDKRGKEQVSQ